jgi:hypothetical protein
MKIGCFLKEKQGKIGELINDGIPNIPAV